MTDAPLNARSRALAALIPLLAVFVIKLAVFLDLGRHVLLVPVGPQDDAFYAQLADRVAHGDVWLADPASFAGQPAPPFFLSPLYVYVLAAALKVSGGSLAFARLVQIALGTVGVWLLTMHRAALVWRAGGLVDGRARVPLRARDILRAADRSGVARSVPHRARPVFDHAGHRSRLVVRLGAGGRGARAACAQPAECAAGLRRDGRAGALLGVSSERRPSTVDGRRARGRDGIRARGPARDGAGDGAQLARGPPVRADLLAGRARRAHRQRARGDRHVRARDERRAQRAGAVARRAGGGEPRAAARRLAERDVAILPPPVTRLDCRASVAGGPAAGAQDALHVERDVHLDQSQLSVLRARQLQLAHAAHRRPDAHRAVRPGRAGGREAGRSSRLLAVGASTRLCRCSRSSRSSSPRGIGCRCRSRSSRRRARRSRG